jgi:hypothetical protein
MGWNKGKLQGMKGEKGFRRHLIKLMSISDRRGIHEICVVDEEPHACKDEISAFLFSAVH